NPTRGRINDAIAGSCAPYHTLCTSGRCILINEFSEACHEGDRDMRRDLTIKTGSMAGTSDFRVIAPIKKGVVPSLDATTYKTRVKYVLRTLNAGRAGAFEFELARILSDAVDRVGRIHSVGIAVLEPEDQVLLTVTFDGVWEAYVRTIWQKVA